MNIKDIARMAGVSTSTVSKIVNNKDASISPETREKVLRIVREYHYTPYSFASRGSKSWKIGVLLRSPISFDTTLDGIVHTAQDSGYGTLVFNSYTDVDQELKNIAALAKHHVDGVIWEPACADSLKLKPQLDRLDVPTLTIGPYGGDQSLLLPYGEAAYKLTEELINRGHTGIACLLTRGRRTQDFLEGFKRCLFDHGMAFDESMVRYALDDSLEGRIGSHAITGVVSSHYRMALEFHQLMGTLHYRMPQDVSLVSIRNDTNEALSYPGSTELSTYTIRNADFGDYLCAKLITTVEGRSEQPRSFVQEYHLDNTSTLDVPPSLKRRKIIVVGGMHITNTLSMPKLPSEGATVNARLSSVSPGGRGVNQAVGAAKLGHRVSMIGNVGADADYIFREMARWGVDTTGVSRRAHSKTGQAYIFVDRRGESMTSVLPGANAELSAADIADKEELFADAAYCLVQSEVPLEAVEAACRAAHRHHASTILKPSGCDRLPEGTLQAVDLLVPNENELDTLVPDADALSLEDKARRLIDQGAGAVIVTLGERGCLLVERGRARAFPAADFTPADNTGAGDAFISALASYLMYGHTLDEAIEIGMVAAGYSITHEGVIPSLVDRPALEGLLHAAA